MKAYYPESALVNLLINYPNFVRPDLRPFMPGIQWGEIKVYFRRKYLDKENEPDLTFVTEREVFLFEAKKELVNLETLCQYRRYEAIVRERYPNHDLFGYLVGLRCEQRDKIEGYIGSQQIQIMLFDGTNLPKPGHEASCECGAGLAPAWAKCNVCGRSAQSTRWR